MKRSLVLATLACLLTLALAVPALAQSPIATPVGTSTSTVSAILPIMAPNDRDTAVVISGSGFATATTGTVQPTVTLGTTPLGAVVVQSSTTLTATVPQGMAPGLYDLTVTNPDGGTATLPGAFTVTLPPTVASVTPQSADNDISTTVTISGTNFATDATGTLPPTAKLGSSTLTNVTLVNATTLTATVPWGMNPAVYPLTVTNPDGGSSTLAGAFTVGAGIGNWNGGQLKGGDVRQLLIKPDDPSTLYAPAYGLTGLFRSSDSGTTWNYTGASLTLNNGELAVTPEHPDWLYAYCANGLLRSTDEGDTWSVVMPNAWPDGKAIDQGQVYPSPSDPDILFLSSYYEPLESGSSSDAQGLIRSTDDGATWTILSDLAGQSVEDVAFEPQDPSNMVAVTQDAKVYLSTDAGADWSLTGGTLPVSSIGFQHALAFNPYVAGEVWIVSTDPNAAVKSTDAALDGWTDLSANQGGSGGSGLSFTSDGSVYIGNQRSTDGGTTWQRFSPNTTNTAPVFPDPTDPTVAYVPDGTYGVQKSSDGGADWSPADQGLCGMTCSSLDVSPANPLELFATFGNWSGAYRSSDAAADWSYVAAPGSGAAEMDSVRCDPTDPNRIYAASHSDIFTSTDGGTSWDDLGFNATPTPPSGLLWVLRPDPFEAGHLLAALDTGPYLTGPGYLYSSDDYGVSWQPVTLPQAVARITDIRFDPETAGLVYLATGGAGSGSPGTGVYRSIDHGSTWTAIDDPHLPGMANISTLAIATHPQHVLIGVDGNFYVYRSFDEGTTWQQANTADNRVGGSTAYMFADSDSTRLYAASFAGLYYSADAGSTWTAASGTFGSLQIIGLAYGKTADGRIVLYAATNGGQAGTNSGAAATGLRAAPLPNGMIDAGVYRYVLLTPKLTLTIAGLSHGILRLGRHVGVEVVAKPTALAGSAVAVQVQRLVRHWVAARTVHCTVRSSGTLSWSYKPARKGTYRVRVSIAKTATRSAATTTWHTFKVK